MRLAMPLDEITVEKLKACAFRLQQHLFYYDADKTTEKSFCPAFNAGEM
jgi:hypothetical protein